MHTVTVRPAKAGDGAIIHRFVSELALFEQAAEQVQLTSLQLEEELSKSEPAFHCYIAELAGRAVGFALFHFTFSTWTGKGIHLEDLYVEPEVRRHRVGISLFQAVQEFAQKEGCKRLDWEVLDWNSSAHQFYKRLGGICRAEWTSWRIEF